ncbi:ribosomal protein L7/L12 [Actinomadura sp. WMMA1423]|uniref:ribosomal protein L7/L12 n=1 Tax=Actinomadura sp. WMMA1423 TaxID=2591108 RepID=UPI00197AD374|nr:ribosomal protein L7/L12 [Actinomadura sp. WMMA1423]
MKSVPYVIPEARERAIALVADGDMIPAIKLIRQATGLGLKEAKEYVDGLKGEAYARTVPFDVQAKARALLAEGRGKDAAKLVHRETSLGMRAAKDYVTAVQEGWVPAEPHTERPLLSDRVRAFKAAGDHESAIAVVCAETGMHRGEAQRFVEALD